MGFMVAVVCVGPRSDMRSRGPVLYIDGPWPALECDKDEARSLGWPAIKDGK